MCSTDSILCPHLNNNQCSRPCRNDCHRSWPPQRNLSRSRPIRVITRLAFSCFTHSSCLAFRPHILAPTASDLVKYGQKDTILAGFHSDLNFLTIHGRSRYPGLHIWARNTGKRIPVKIPEGSNLLVQAGKQLEHITGGLIKAGLHEVVVNEQTIGVCHPALFSCNSRALTSLMYRPLRNAKFSSQTVPSSASRRLSSGTSLLTMTSSQSQRCQHGHGLSGQTRLTLADTRVTKLFTNQ